MLSRDSDPGVGDMLSSSGSHSSPLFDFLTAFAPRKLKDLFRLCEYLYFNSAQIYAALQKFCTYPVTDIIYKSTNEALKKQYKKLHDKIIKTKRKLIQAAIDKFVYGNGFFSVYSPFIRFLKCEHCQHLTNIQTLNYKFKLKKLEFTYTCAGCRVKAIAGPDAVIDQKITRADRVSIIRWDAKLMDIDYNPITGHSIYYYTIPKELKERASKGNKHLINTLPMEFLKALRDDKIFEFAEGQLFHMKMDAPAGIEAQWGFPPLASTIKLFFYAAVLRKANECVALDAPVETSTGLVCADDVKVGDLVRSHTGAWRPVTDKWYRDARPGEIGRKITLSGLRGLPTTYSPKHPIMTVRRNRDSRRSDTKDVQPSYVVMKNPHLYEEAFAPAGLLTVGDYVLYPRKLPAVAQTVDVAAYSGLRSTDGYVYSNEMSDATIEAFEQLEEGKWIPHDNAGRVAKRYVRENREPKRIPATRPMTDDLAYILGWYTGDGACNQRTAGFSLGLDDAPTPLIEAIQREFGLNAGDVVNADGNIRTISASHIIVRNLIKGMVPGHAREKQVPPEVLNGPDAVKLAFLRGYHEADGHYAKTRNTFSTSSQALAYDVYRMVLHFGCIATIGNHVTKDSILKDGRVIKGGNIHHHVDVNGPSRERLHALWEGQACPEVSVGKSGYFWKDYFASRISAIEEVEEPRYIDFKIGVDETFCVAGTATHNCIALDYIVPLRIISPKVASGNADPMLQISLGRWADEMKTSVKRWRRDPLHIMWSPIPAEVTHLGGQARALMTLAEVQAAEDNIIAALGLPKEFIYGGFSAMGSGIQLRVLENQLLHQTGDLNDLLQWITDKFAKLLGWGSIEVELAPFKFIDDVQQKTLLLQLNQSDPAGPWVSKTTLGEAFDIDISEERKKRMQEAIDEIRYQQELQTETMKLQNTLAQQVQSQAAMGQQGLAYDQQAVIAQADQMVQQMMGLDPGSRRSQMHALQTEDYVMYAVVSERMKDAQTSQNHEMLTQAKAQTGQDGMGAAPPGGSAAGPPGPGANGAGV